MSALPFEMIQTYQAKTFRLWPELRLHDADQAVQFVNERGFVFFWPISGIIFPSLWTAVAGDRPVADEHDDPGHVTWGWKDSLLGHRRWYYAKVLRKKATMISMDAVAYFYALSENYGAYEEDYLTQYEQGRLTLEARQVYETLLKEGAMDTVTLRKTTRMSRPTSDSRFNRALSDLQADFKIAPVAVTQAGAWHYAFAYDITARYYPEIPDTAHAISEHLARQELALRYFYSLGASQPADLVRLFHWKPNEVQLALDALINAGSLISGVAFENLPGTWYVLSSLL